MALILTKYKIETMHQNGFQPMQTFKDVIFKERLKKREIWINGNIDDGLIERLYVNLLDFDEAKPKEKIWVMVNSYGGNLYESLVATDIMRTISSPVVTVAMAKATSGGFIIFMGGDLRVIHENTMLMMHTASLGCYDRIPAIRNKVEYSDRTHERLADFLSNQTHGKTRPNFWLEMFKNEKDIYFTPEEAVKLGLAHRVIGRYNNEVEKYIWKV